jgi:protoheme IX farnesyltransferase
VAYLDDTKINPAVTGEARVEDYFALLKPSVMSLVVFTAFVGLVVAPGSINPILAVIAVFAIAVGGGASGALNMWYDSDIDAIMSRTANRPIPAGRITREQALVFGLVLSVCSVTLLGLATNWVAGGLLAFTIFFYAVIYTIWLKRRTPQNIVWGGAAGCMPVLIGWSAVTGGVSWTAVLLFGVIFFWTPPHYWPLSMKFRQDYAAAGVPMLPVVAKDTKVAREMIAYTIAMIACSLLLVPVQGMTWVYGVVALALGLWFLWACIGLLRRAEHPEAGKLRAMSVFHASITYLTLLSVAIAVDVFLPF